MVCPIPSLLHTMKHSSFKTHRKISPTSYQVASMSHKRNIPNLLSGLFLSHKTSKKTTSQNTSIFKHRTCDPGSLLFTSNGISSCSQGILWLKRRTSSSPAFDGSYPSSPSHLGRKHLWVSGAGSLIYPLVNQQFDPESYSFWMETHLPTPMTGRVNVNLLESTSHEICRFDLAESGGFAYPSYVWNVGPTMS